MILVLKKPNPYYRDFYVIIMQPAYFTKAHDLKVSVILDALIINSPNSVHNTSTRYTNLSELSHL